MTDTPIPANQPAPSAETEAAPAAEVRLLAEMFFWLFAGFGVAIAAAWVLIPEYLEYRGVLEETQQVRREVARLELRNGQYSELLEALQDPEHLKRYVRSRTADTDPGAASAEIADQSPELRLPEPTAEAIQTQQEKIPGTRPLLLSLPPRWVALFTEHARRPVLLAIAVGCLTIAFAFFAPQYGAGRV